MELDKRILPGKRPLGCFDTEEAKEFIGKEGYFADCMKVFTNVRRYRKCILTAINEEAQRCFQAADVNYWDYFLPADWVKSEEPENKWRPFTLDEFIDRFDLEVGTRVFLIRSKTTPVNQRRLLLTGIIQDKDPDLCGIGLGPYFFKFSELFIFHEVKFGEKDWQPFGVEDTSE